MKLYYLGILNNKQKPAIQLCAEYELSDYSRFTRNDYAGFMTAVSKIVAERTMPGQRQSIEQEGYMFHCFARPEGVASVIISKDYPSLAAHAILSKVLDEYLVQHTTMPPGRKDGDVSFPFLRECLDTYQDPAQASNISAIQHNLDETKIMLHKTIDAVLQRGEKIDDLIEKSSDLSARSKAFYQGAKRQNSCCAIM
ncbi:snare-like protein [Xylariaceae sp. AK1471]|nr:snare-like protein [Xylariaceae sp. AK1471]